SACTSPNLAASVPRLSARTPPNERLTSTASIATLGSDLDGVVVGVDTNRSNPGGWRLPLRGGVREGVLAASCPGCLWEADVECAGAGFAGQCCLDADD